MRDCRYDASLGIVLGHRRLSILDLSQAGHQPMMSQSGRFVIAYNGEIYNFRELIHCLRHDSRYEVPLRGHSDTEVMLACFECSGSRSVTDANEWHVCICFVGPSGTRLIFVPRPNGREAAVLWVDWQHFSCSAPN